MPAVIQRNAFAAILTVLFVAPAWATEAASPPDYAGQIAPLLAKYCLGCHSSDYAEGELALDSAEAIQRGGSRGAAIVAGDAEESLLLKLIEGRAEPSMPPEDSPAPTPEEVALLRAWIVAGAEIPAELPPAPALTTPEITPIAPVRQPVNALAYSPDGSLLAVAGYREVRLLSAADRGLQRTLTGDAGNANALAFTPDGTRLIVAAGEPGLYGEVSIWNPTSGELLLRFQGHKDTLYAVAVSAAEGLLATASYDDQVMLWELATGSFRSVLQGHNDAVYDLAFSPDGRLLVTASGDRTIKLWDVASGQRLDTFGQSTKELYTVAFNPEGTRVFGGGADSRIRQWEISQTGAEGTNPLQESRFAHEKAIIKLVASPDGKLLATAGEDRTVKLWDAATLSERHLWPDQPDWTSALAFSPDSATLAIGRLDGTLAFVQTGDGAPVPVPAPELTAVRPRGIQRGTTTRLQITGKHLVELTAAAATHAGLSVRPLDDAQQAADHGWLEVTASAEVPRGSYEISVTTAGGTSQQVKLFVDDIPQTEAPEDQAAATAVTLPLAGWGTLRTPGDTHHWQFSADAGATLVCELAARSLGSPLAGVLTLSDSEGRVLATNSGHKVGMDPLLVFAVPEPGEYVLRVSDLTFSGSEKHTYRLSMGELPLVAGVYPLSIPAHETSSIELVGYNLPETDLELTAEAPGELAIAVPTTTGLEYRLAGGTPLKIKVGHSAETREQEPNNVPPAATVLSLPGVAVGRIAEPADDDLYRITAKTGQTWIIETEAARLGSPVDTKIEVLDAAGQPVPRMLLQAVRDSAVAFRGVNSITPDIRLDHWEEMELNQYVYNQGEVTRLFRIPRGPDSGFLLYAWGGQRIAYFDTSPTTHALEEPTYIVRPLPLDATIVPNGLPVFTHYYENDDDGQRKLGSDSYLRFTALESGEYLIRLRDVRGHGGPAYGYRLIVRQPQPDFQISIGGQNPAVQPGGGRAVIFTADRRDGFDEEIQIDVTGLPPGFHASSPVVIEAGHNQAQMVVYADADADADAPVEEVATASQVTATAVVAGATVTKPLGTLGKITLAPVGKLRVWLEPAELTIRPGTLIPATLKISRNEFNDPVNFELENLPHGVYVEDIGLNGVLIRPDETERPIFITARPWVPETTRSGHAVATSAGGEASPPFTLHVRHTEELAQNPAAEASPAESTEPSAP